MEKLTQLIRSLNSLEIKAVRRFFKLTRVENTTLKAKLFDIILKNKNISDINAAKKLKRNATDPSYIMLKKRLRDDIVKVLIWEEKAKVFASKSHEAKYKCRLLIMEAELLIVRGLPGLAEESLQKGFRLSSQYELTNESIVINELLQTQVGLKKGLSSYKFYANNNLENFDVIREKFVAQDYFRKLNMPNLFFANKEMNFRDRAKEATDELRSLSEKSRSVQVQVWYLRSEIYYNHLIADYDRARTSAEQFLRLVIDSPIVYSRDNTGGANMQLSIIHIYLGNYRKAREYAQEAITLFVKGSLNQINAYDCLYIAHIYERNYSEAQTVLETVKSIKVYKTNTPINSKWLYYEANLFFLMQKFDDALATLQKQTDLTSDKSGWRLGYKILEMMCIVELGYMDWLDYRIETFRKLLSDVKKENIARPKIVLQLIRGFIKSSYNFQLTTKNNKEHLTLLQKGADDFKWDPRGYEIIRFEVWWKSKSKPKRLASTV